MRLHSKYRPELWGLSLLLILFCCAAYYFETKGQEVTPTSTPSTFNASTPGTKALFLLYQQEHYNVTRLEAPYSALDRRFGLLIVNEPLERTISTTELPILRHWIEDGGTLLYVASAPERPVDPKDTILKDIAIVRGTESPTLVQPTLPGSPYCKDISSLRIQSPVRLATQRNARYSVLFRDACGDVALEKPIGLGHVLATTGISPANSGISDADNALFYYNVAETVPHNKIIAFDEYHHGVGFSNQNDHTTAGLFANAPLPVQRFTWHFLVLLVLILFNGNVRYGRIRLTAKRQEASADYIRAMARLYQRANAPGAAINTLYKQFVLDIAVEMQLNQLFNTEEVLATVEQRYHLESGPFRLWISACESVLNGHRISNQDALRLSDQLEQYRRRCHLVRNR